MRRKERIGKKFGHLTAISYAKSSSAGKLRYNCLCECGGKKEASGSALDSGVTSHCGCVNNFKTHGMFGTRIYRIWGGMISRCYSDKNGSYRNYGARGITVCESWRGSFVEFYEWAKRAGYHDGLEIDRIDVNLGYGPENCRWLTRTQNCNNMRKNIRYEYNGKDMTLAEIATYANVDYDRLYGRVRVRGMDIPKAIKAIKDKYG